MGCRPWHPDAGHELEDRKGTTVTIKRPNEVKLVGELTMQVAPILAGRPPEIQGAVLCKCLALWLAGWASDLPPAERDAQREEMLAFHLKYVREMVATYDLARERKARKKKAAPGRAAR
jgi:hypothetical protein